MGGANPDSLSKGFFSFHRNSFHDKKRLSVTMHDRVFERIRLLYSFVSSNDGEARHKVTIK